MVSPEKTLLLNIQKKTAKMSTFLQLLLDLEVDGATAWQRFWFVRLPLLRAAILVALVIRTVEAFRVFDIIYVITAGGPAS